MINQNWKNIFHIRLRRNNLLSIVLWLQMNSFCILVRNYANQLFRKFCIAWTEILRSVTAPLMDHDGLWWNWNWMFASSTRILWAAFRAVLFSTGTRTLNISTHLRTVVSAGFVLWYLGWKVFQTAALDLSWTYQVTQWKYSWPEHMKMSSFCLDVW